MFSPRFLYIAALLFVLVAKANAQSFWQHKFNVQRDIAYGDLPAQKLDIYGQGQWTGPPNYFVYDKTPNKTLIYIHGGAWHGGSKESALWSVMPFVEQGWQAISIEYRRGGATAPNAATDVLLAMNWIAKNAADYGIDLNNLVISGDSAGGHLALTAGFTITNPKTSSLYKGRQIPVKAIINWFGITDVTALDKHLSDEGQWNYPRLWAGNDKTLRLLDEHYSPINLISPLAPPVLTLHGTIDKVVPFSQATALHNKLDIYKVENKLLALKNGKHLGFTEGQFQQIFSEIFEFLAAN